MEPEEQKQNGEDGAGPKEPKKLLGKFDTKKVAIFTGIPMYLLGGLLVGYVIGRFVENKFPSNNLLFVLFVLLGVAAGFKLVIDDVKKFMD